jgi:dTDP-4-dehydrorhamnose reductase
MRVAVFGSSGQLGGAIYREAPNLALGIGGRLDEPMIIECVPRSIDIVNETDTLGYLAATRPDWVVNVAAMTNVDAAEADPFHAIQINALGAANVARGARQVGARSLYVSTEAVFDGDYATAYREGDPCTPQSAYGVSKLAGEHLVRIADEEAFVVRTSWLYSGERGNNFPTRLRHQLEAHQNTVPVVTDLVGNPTSTSVLSRAILRIIATPPEPGIYHIACQGAASKYEWAIEITEALGYDASRIGETTTDAYPTAARRSKHVDLSCEKFLETSLAELPEWRLTCRETLLGIDA